MDLRRHAIASLGHHGDGDITIGSLVSYCGSGMGVVLGIRSQAKTTIVDVLWSSWDSVTFLQFDKFKRKRSCN